MKVKISMDSVSFESKPSGKAIVNAKYRAASNWCEIELKKLADLNGNKGYAIIPAHMEGGIKAENCSEMQILALDFDSGCTFKEIKNRCDRMGLNITYAYHTFSSSEETEKFRIIFVLSKPETDCYLIKTMILMLHTVFPESDSSCKNLDRIYLGGKELIHYDDNARIAMVQIYFAFLRSVNSEKHRSEKIRSFAKKQNVLLINNNLCMGELRHIDVIFGGNKDSTVIHITAETINPPFFVAENKLHPGITCKERKVNKKRIALSDGGTNCQLYNDFEEGTILGHEEKFAIATNLISINGGIKHFLEIIKKYYGKNNFNKWNDAVLYMKSYYPKRCSEEFCPYYKECSHENTIVDTLAMDRKVYQGKEEYVSIEEAAGNLEANLYNAFQCTDDGIYLIKAQTGLGKTTAYIDLIKENKGNKFLIALPTNMLKEEVGKKLSMGSMADDVYITPSVNGNSFFPAEIQEEISAGHQQGLHNVTKRVIRAYMKEIKEKSSYELARIEECEKILKDASEIKQRIVVTTHAYLLQMKEETLKKYTIIIDEDFLMLQGFNRMCSVSISCLEELSEKGLGIYSRIAGTLIKAEEGVYQTMNMGAADPLSEKQLEDLEFFGIGDNINDLKDAKAFVRMKDRDTEADIIKYFCPPSLPKLKYIVLSATFNYEIYKLYFKGKMEVFSYGEQKATYKGKLIQYTYHSLGRKDLSGKMEVFSTARKISDNEDLDIITFKCVEKIRGMERLNKAGIHFGNSTGLNLLSGKDIAIVGTPYSVDENYKLVACYLGADVNKKADKRPIMRRVHYKNNSFLITTYADEILREVQLYSIESELEQCVGRARLLRNDCTVYVFSSFPCEQAHIDSRNYLSGSLPE